MLSQMSVIFSSRSIVQNSQYFSRITVFLLNVKLVCMNVHRFYHVSCLIRNVILDRLIATNTRFDLSVGHSVWAFTWHSKCRRKIFLKRFLKFFKISNCFCHNFPYFWLSLYSTLPLHSKCTYLFTYTYNFLKKLRKVAIKMHDNRWQCIQRF